MELFINNKSGAPIYDQIYNQIKQQIISGALQPDEAMPSIRGLARDLRISVITTKRAYDELEKAPSATRTSPLPSTPCSSSAASTTAPSSRSASF